MAHNLFWIWEERTKFHEKSAHFCTLWENASMKSNQSSLTLLSIQSFYFGNSFFLINAIFLELTPLAFFSALTHCIKSWADYSSPFLLTSNPNHLCQFLSGLMIESLSTKTPYLRTVLSGCTELNTRVATSPPPPTRISIKSNGCLMTHPWIGLINYQSVSRVAQGRLKFAVMRLEPH